MLRWYAIALKQARKRPFFAAAEAEENTQTQIVKEAVRNAMQHASDQVDREPRAGCVTRRRAFWTYLSSSIGVISVSASAPILSTGVGRRSSMPSSPRGLALQRGRDAHVKKRRKCRDVNARYVRSDRIQPPRNVLLQD